MATIIQTSFNSIGKNSRNCRRGWAFPGRGLSVDLGIARRSQLRSDDSNLCQYNLKLKAELKNEITNWNIFSLTWNFVNHINCYESLWVFSTFFRCVCPYFFSQIGHFLWYDLKTENHVFVLFLLRSIQAIQSIWLETFLIMFLYYIWWTILWIFKWFFWGSWHGSN